MSIHYESNHNVKLRFGVVFLICGRALEASVTGRLPCRVVLTVEFTAAVQDNYLVDESLLTGLKIVKSDF